MFATSPEIMESAKHRSLRQSLKASSAVSRAERCAMLLLLRSHTRASNRIIMKSKLPHRFRIQQISPVEDDRCTHFFPYHRKVHIAKFIPIGGDDQRFSIADCLDCG